MSLTHREIADGIKSGKYWHTQMMSEVDQKEFRYLSNFSSLVHSTSIQVTRLMKENGIVAFLGNHEIIDNTMKINGLPIFSSHQSLKQSDMDIINNYIRSIT
jgi:hypothetical protein